MDEREFILVLLMIQAYIFIIFVKVYWVNLLFKSLNPIDLESSVIKRESIIVKFFDLLYKMEEVLWLINKVKLQENNNLMKKNGQFLISFQVPYIQQSHNMKNFFVYFSVDLFFCSIQSRQFLNFQPNQLIYFMALNLCK